MIFYYQIDSTARGVHFIIGIQTPWQKTSLLKYKRIYILGVLCMLYLNNIFQ